MTDCQTIGCSRLFLCTQPWEEARRKKRPFSRKKTAFLWAQHSINRELGSFSPFNKCFIFTSWEQ